MSTVSRLSVVGLLIAGMLSACSSKKTNGSFDDSGNLLSNGSFEVLGKPTLVEWSSFDPDLVEFILDAPQGGGRYSLGLATSWLPPTGIVWTSVAGIQSGDILTLSASVRHAAPGAWFDRIGIKYGPDPWGAGKWVYVNDTVWTTVTIVDTVSLSDGDSVYVVLQGPGCEVCLNGTARFDLITLARQ